MTPTRKEVRGAMKWNWIHHNGRILYDVGVLADDTLYNPHGYVEADVREAVRQAKERLHARRSAAAKKAAITRERRIEKRIHEIAREIVENRWAMRGPRPKCFICGKRLSDGESVARGIGPECWQQILRMVEARATSQMERAEANAGAS